MTDEAAMTSVVQGDLDKAAILYERYKRPMFNFYLRYGLERDESQDFTQQVFYRLIHYRHTYREGFEFRTWIYRIARNIYHDSLKANARFDYSVKVEDLEEQMNLAESTNNAEEQHELIQKALEKLPNDYREVLQLSRYEELKYEEIADILGCTVAVVKVRVHRAIKKLREVYFQLSEQ